MSDADEKPETIGELHDRLPPGEWQEAYGLRWKRVAQPLPCGWPGPVRDDYDPEENDHA